jgi:sphingolipid delta-4 desaturase
MWASSDDSLAKKDFSWSETDEPHATRRKEILKKYPQIKTLFTKEPMTAVVVLFIFFTQMTIAYYIRDYSYGILVLVAYLYGGTVNHTLQLAVHDLSHNLAFESLFANRIFALTANLCTGTPSAMTFTRYHMDHHQFQGVHGIDTDVPTMWEVRTFTNALLKFFWVILQPAFYALRPMLVKPQSPTRWEVFNGVLQISFDIAIVYFWGPKSLIYLVTGTLLGLGLHPCAGHFIAEHYEFTKGSETYSYYGPLNYLNLNVGYHYEHHDFPKIPWSNLPRVRQIAPEFYNNLPHYDSYLKVFWKYITDPTVGPHSRIKRKTTKALEDLRAVQKGKVSA